MNYNKIRSFCSVFRVLLGIGLIITGVIQLGVWEYAPWLFLGAIPLIAGLTKFCPLCMITKKCTI